MLTHLHIRHFAIIDDSELELADGMTALTGETGAGKSILLGALGLVLGARASSLDVQQGATRAEIAASFRIDARPGVRAWLERHELDSDEDCVLRRTLSANGKSRATVNGTPVSLKMLGELGERLVGIHGQHAHQTLGRAAEQRRLLDAWGAARGDGSDADDGGSGRTNSAKAGKTPARAKTAAKARTAASGKKIAAGKRAKKPGAALAGASARADAAIAPATTLVADVAAAHAAWSEADARLSRALDESEGRVQRVDLLRFQLQEFDELDIGATSLAEIESEHRWLANVERLRTLGTDALEALDDGASAALSRALKPLQALVAIDERLREALDLVESASIQTDEATSVLRAEVSALEHDDARLAWLDAKLGQLHALARKHRCETAELADVEQRLRDELDSLTGPGAGVEALETERDARLGDYLDLAGRLSARRLHDATALAALVSDAMATLAMDGGRFVVDVTADPSVRSPHGIDTVTFLVSPNPGVDPAPLGRIASGGELSRIGLCLQLATSDSRAVPTLIFDEVDAGVGGAVAETVGQLLRRVGRNAQVLCVTHLPQVAAQAHHHLRVTKRVADGRTRTDVEPLDDAATRDEIARMLGGAKITRKSRQHAREMLDAAGRATPTRRSTRAAGERDITVRRHLDAGRNGSR